MAEKYSQPTNDIIGLNQQRKKDIALAAWQSDANIFICDDILFYVNKYTQPSLGSKE